MADHDKNNEDLWGNDRSKWVWGIFYYNKDDKRLLPPKRLPFLGWTINFANPYSILIFVAILTIIGLVVAFAK